MNIAWMLANAVCSVNWSEIFSEKFSYFSLLFLLILCILISKYACELAAWMSGRGNEEEKTEEWNEIFWKKWKNSCNSIGSNNHAKLCK